MTLNPAAAVPPHHLLMLAFPPAQSLDVVAPLEVFAQANQALAAEGRPAAYRLSLASLSGTEIDTSSGLIRLVAEPLDPGQPPPDSLVLAGGPGARDAAGDPAILARLRPLIQDSPRVLSVCTGAFPLVASGALAGRRVTTHWRHCAALAAAYPEVTVEPDALFVSDGKFHSSAGVTAGIDLALALVERDLGARIALTVARNLVVFLRRPGGQSQFSAHLLTRAGGMGIGEGAAPDGDRIAALTAWMLDHPAADLSVPALAARAGMSPRNFARRFRAATGLTPGDYVLRLRLDMARRLLAEAGLGLAAIAARSGFGSAEAMRLAFQKHLKVAPGAFRARFLTRAPIFTPLADGLSPPAPVSTV